MVGFIGEVDGEVVVGRIVGEIDGLPKKKIKIFTFEHLNLKNAILSKMEIISDNRIRDSRRLSLVLGRKSMKISFWRRVK